jgi:hypothetical protein
MNLEAKKFYDILNNIKSYYFINAILSESYLIKISIKFIIIPILKINYQIFILINTFLHFIYDNNSINDNLIKSHVLKQQKINNSYEEIELTEQDKTNYLNDLYNENNIVDDSYNEIELIKMDEIDFNNLKIINNNSDDNINNYTKINDTDNIIINKKINIIKIGKK